MKNVLVLGYFGYETNQIDGQTIKTRNFYNLLEKEFNEFDLNYFDTQKINKNKYQVIKLLFLILTSRIIFLLPGENNLNKLLKILMIISSIFNKEVYLVAVGGWLPEYIEHKKNLFKSFKKIKLFFVESKAMLIKMKIIGFENVNVFPNFRIHNFESKDIIVSNDEFKIIFCARIMKEKGYDYLFDLGRYFLKNSNKFKKKIIIDFYGPLDKKDSEEFLNKIKEFNFITYRGIIDPDKVFNVVSRYDVNILPTYYEGEGFPGTIIDSYIAGVPMIISNWKDLPEYVVERETGFIFDLENRESLYSKVLEIANDEDLNKFMKEKSLTYSNQFSEDKARKILKEKILR